MNISVVIPTHNVAPWIAETLGSLRAQTRLPNEVIVVDDASSDDTVRQVRASGLATKILTVNCRNAAAARNQGVVAATGDWIAFLDGDDLWQPEHLETFVRWVGAHDVGYFAHHHGFDDATHASELRTPLQSSPASELSDQTLLHYFVGKNHGWPTSGMITRRKEFLAAGGFDEEQLRRHDAEMFLRLVKGQTWTYCSDATWRYRLRRQGNVSGDYASCSVYYLNALLKIERLYQDERLRPMIRAQAKKALSFSVKSRRPDEFAKALKLAAGRVGMATGLFFQFAKFSPKIARWALTTRALLGTATLRRQPGGAG